MKTAIVAHRWVVSQHEEALQAGWNDDLTQGGADQGRMQRLFIDLQIIHCEVETDL